MYTSMCVDVCDNTSVWMRRASSSAKSWENVPNLCKRCVPRCLVSATHKQGREGLQTHVGCVVVWPNEVRHDEPGYATVLFTVMHSSVSYLTTETFLFDSYTRTGSWTPPDGPPPSYQFNFGHPNRKHDQTKPAQKHLQKQTAQCYSVE